MSSPPDHQSLIIVIDGDERTGTDVSEWLSRAGHEVIVRETPIGATALVLRHRPTLVLVEHRLSPISGAEVVRLIKRHPSLAETPVVVTSASLDLEEVASGCDADGYLRKPITRSELMRAIGPWLRGEMLPRRSTLPPLKLPPAPLFVDDDPSMLEHYRQTFASMGRAEFAQSGKDALRHILSKSPPDVVVCDVVMPQITGMDLYEIANYADERWRDRFVFVTGKKLNDPEVARVHQTEVPLLFKPVEPTRLTDAILLHGV